MGSLPSSYTPIEDDEWLESLKPENMREAALLALKEKQVKGRYKKPSSEKTEDDEYSINTPGGVKSEKNQKNWEEDLPGFDHRKSIVFADFSKIQHHKGFPRFYADAEHLVRLEDIDVSNSLIVYVSHCWLRPKDLIPHPDNTKSSKYSLLIEGIRQTLKEYAPGFQHCYLWVDYLCLNQLGTSMSRNLRAMDRIIECCDCIFTPIYDPSVWHEPPGGMINYYEQYKAESWNEGDNAYIHRGWCRLEMILSSIVPVTNRTLCEGANRTDTGKRTVSRGISTPVAARGLPKGVQDRTHKFEGGLLYNIARDQRPHLLYGNHESIKNLPPIVLPRMRSVLFERFNPVLGNFSEEKDRDIVKRLYRRYRPYMSHLTKGYRGEYNNSGEMHGFGLYIYMDQTMYEGEWRNDKKNGKGIFKAIDSIFTGVFINDKRNGPGTQRFNNGDYFEGIYVNDLLEGDGHFQCETGDKYIGNFVKGKKHGHGSFTFGWGTRKGDVYVGDWFEDKKSGSGVYTYAADGAVYKGQWWDDKKHGDGVYQYGSSALYEGEFKCGYKDGYGTYFFTSGDVYEGEYKANKMHGKGKYQYVGSTVFEGMFQSGKKWGPGVLRHANGDSFEGVWDDGKKTGGGIYKHKNGAIYYPDVNEGWNLD